MLFTLISSVLPSATKASLARAGNIYSKTASQSMSHIILSTITTSGRIFDDTHIHPHASTE